MKTICDMKIGETATVVSVGGEGSLRQHFLDMGLIPDEEITLVTDLPGIYSMSPYSNEEILSREFIMHEKPKAIINIVDATNIERNLYLTMQLMEMNTPMVLALNMMDEVSGNGGSIKVNEMESMLGIPVIPISASKGEGIKELIDHAIHVAQYQEKPERQDFCNIGDNGGAVHRCLHSIMHLIEDHAENANVPLRFAAAKIIEGDDGILEALDLTQNELETIEHLIMQMEHERGLDRAAAISLLVFCLLYTPCAAAIAAVKNELGARWAFVICLGQCIIAWIAAFIAAMAAYLII